MGLTDPVESLTDPRDRSLILWTDEYCHATCPLSLSSSSLCSDFPLNLSSVIILEVSLLSWRYVILVTQ